MKNKTYISKTLSFGNVTITVRRPDLDEAERTKRAKRIVDTLEHSLRGYLQRSVQ